jgi:hypothetical protein
VRRVVTLVTENPGFERSKLPLCSVPDIFGTKRGECASAGQPCKVAMH